MTRVASQSLSWGWHPRDDLEFATDVSLSSVRQCRPTDVKMRGSNVTRVARGVGDRRGWFRSETVAKRDRV
ncbi:hypothetical protein D8S78_14645 [Natrialba swarupiae]|nr:hypothetical protein [Natrialba swarupiae]